MKKHWLWMAAVVAAVPSSGVVANAPLPDLTASAPAAYHLGPGDQIRIAVVGLDTMANSYMIDDTGTIAPPMIAPVDLNGKTIREAEAAIANGILAKKLVLNPAVSVQIVAYRPFYISGEVQHPGQYAYVPGMSVLTAVSMAGGYTFRAKQQSAIVTRASAKGRATQDTAVLPGDIIVVPESWF